jgi:hypothetical protein
MTQRINPIALAGLVLAGALLAACSPQAAASFSDAFAYCAAVGTIDAPDSRYTGPRMPEAVAQGLRAASGAAPDAPMELFTDNAFWRCADGKVLACTVGANLPCTEKASSDQTPTQEMKDFCQANASAEVIPAAVTGRATVYEWRCASGAPEVVRQVVEVDAQGFLKDIWYQIPAP